MKTATVFWEKKGIAKPIKTVRGTSQVLLSIKFFGRDDLKLEKPIAHQTALKF
jgi:hypothetical protein